MVVFKGSKSNITEQKSIGEWPTKARKVLLEKNILKKENEVYIFQEDYIFNSPSGAAAVVLARNANGWTEWKDRSGKTLDERFRKNIDS